MSGDGAATDRSAQRSESGSTSASVAAAPVGSNGAAHETGIEQSLGAHGVEQSSAGESGACAGSIPESPFDMPA